MQCKLWNSLCILPTLSIINKPVNVVSWLAYLVCLGYGMTTSMTVVLDWVRSNPRCSVSQFQRFGGLVHPARLCTNTLYSYIHKIYIWSKKKLQLRRVRWMHVWNLWGSVPPTGLRTTALWPRLIKSAHCWAELGFATSMAAIWKLYSL